MTYEIVEQDEHELFRPIVVSYVASPIFNKNYCPAGGGLLSGVVLRDNAHGAALALKIKFLLKHQMTSAVAFSRNICVHMWILMRFCSLRRCMYVVSHLWLCSLFVIWTILENGARHGVLIDHKPVSCRYAFPVLPYQLSHWSTRS